MSLITIKNTIVLLSAVFAAILAFATSFKSNTKKDNQSKKSSKVTRWLSIIVFIFAITSAVLTFYLSSYESSCTTGTLEINVANPIIVNYNGIERDEYIIDANYIVLGQTSIFSENTIIKLKNIKTLETYEYNTMSINNGFSIPGFKSGTYRVWINCDKYPEYTNIIDLSTNNLKNGKWDFTAYYFDFFDNNSKELDFVLSDKEIEEMEHSVFSIHSEQCDLFRLFRTEIVGNRLKGEFRAIPNDTYYLASGVSPSNFETKELFLK